MALVSRPTKTPSGGVSWQTGDDIDQASIEGDIGGLVTQVNGNLDNDNIASGADIEGSKLEDGAITNAKVNASAAIVVSKLAQTAGQLDSDIVDDSADDAPTYQTVTTPGASGSVSLPTNLEEEWERIRYAVGRLGLGTSAAITSGATAAAWFDGVTIGENVLYNGAFLDNSVAPTGWTVTGATPPTLVTLPVAEGSGKGINFTDAAGLTTDGLAQTLALKASTLYLVTVRLIDNTADVDITTTGATGTFGNLAMTADAGAYQTIVGVIQTDATPTNIVLKINPDATNYDFTVAYASVREVSTTDLSKRDGNLTLYKSSTSATTATVEAALTAAVIPPAPGYKIVVRLVVQYNLGASASCNIELLEEVDGGGTSSAGTARSGTNAGTAIAGSLYVEYVQESPTPGSIYEYTMTVDANLSSNTNQHSLSVRLEKS